MHLFSVSSGVHTNQKVTSWQRQYKNRPAAQPLASYSKSSKEKQYITDSSITPAIRWHTECCQVMGNGGMHIPRLWVSVEYVVSSRQVQVQSVTTPGHVGRGSRESLLRKPVPKLVKCQAPSTKLSKHGLMFVQLPCSWRPTHMLTKPCALGWIKVNVNLSSYSSAPSAWTLPALRSAC